MRKIISILSFMVCLLVYELAFSMEMVVETTGSQELGSLKTGIERIVVLGERIVTFRNSQGMARLVSGGKNCRTHPERQGHLCAVSRTVTAKSNLHSSAASVSS